MKFLICLLIFGASVIPPYLLKYITPYSERAHQICFTFISDQVKEVNIWRSLVCGANLPEGSQKELMRETQLIHLMIVSGAHFMIFSQLLNFLRFPIIANRFILIIYCFITLLQPPSLKGLVSLLLNDQLRLNPETPLFISDIFTCIGGVLCLLLFPEWIDSWSFFLSWMASMALSIPLKKTNLHLRVFIVFMPLHLVWMNLHPAGLICNFIFADIIGVFLFPLALLIMFIPILGPLFDHSVQWLFDVLHWISIEWSLSPPKIVTISSGPPLYLWFFIFFIHSLSHFLRIQIKRNNI